MHMEQCEKNNKLVLPYASEEFPPNIMIGTAETDPDGDGEREREREQKPPFISPQPMSYLTAVVTVVVFDS